MSSMLRNHVHSLSTGSRTLPRDVVKVLNYITWFGVPLLIVSSLWNAHEMFILMVLSLWFFALGLVHESRANRMNADPSVINTLQKIQIVSLLVFIGCLFYFALVAVMV